MTSLHYILIKCLEENFVVWLNGHNAVSVIVVDSVTSEHKVMSLSCFLKWVFASHKSIMWHSLCVYESLLDGISM